MILNMQKIEILHIYSLILKDQKKNIICTMDDVRGDFLGPPHGTTPAAVIANKIIVRSISFINPISFSRLHSAVVLAFYKIPIR